MLRVDLFGDHKGQRSCDRTQESAHTKRYRCHQRNRHPRRVQADAPISDVGGRTRFWQSVKEGEVAICSTMMSRHDAQNEGRWIRWLRVRRLPAMHVGTRSLFCSMRRCATERMRLWPTRRKWHGRETFCSDGILQGKWVAEEARNPEE